MRRVPTLAFLAVLLLMVGGVAEAIAAAGGGSSGFGGGGGGGGGFSGGGGGGGFSGGGGSGGGGGGSGGTGGLIAVLLIFAIFGVIFLAGVVEAARARRRRKARIERVRLASAEAAEDDEAFAADRVERDAAQLFHACQTAWDARDHDAIASLVGPDLRVEWERRLNDFASKGWHNRVKVQDGPHVAYLGLVNREADAEDRVVVELRAALEDYVLDSDGRRSPRRGRPAGPPPSTSTGRLPSGTAAGSSPRSSRRPRDCTISVRRSWHPHGRIPGWPTRRSSRPSWRTSSRRASPRPTWPTWTSRATLVKRPWT